MYSPQTFMSMNYSAIVTFGSNILILTHMNHTPLRIAVLISGGGTNLQSLIDSSAMPDFPAKIVTVISNKRDAYGLTRAKNAGIKTHAITKKEFPNTDAFELRLNALLDEHNIDVICLAGFMRILSPGFTQKWESRILNIHPSLLPKYGGQGMYGMHVHNAVVAAGEKESAHATTLSSTSPAPAFQGRFRCSVGSKPGQ